jgi:hypothetical protein
VNVTCDAWQAGNIDGYLAVTGHWIEETIGPDSISPGRGGKVGSATLLSLLWVNFG